MPAPPLHFYYFIPHDPAIQSLFNYRRRNIKMKEKVYGFQTFSKKQHPNRQMSKS